MLTVEMWAFLSGFSCPTTILLLLASISLGPGEVTHSNYLVGKGLRRGVRRLQQVYWVLQCVAQFSVVLHRGATAWSSSCGQQKSHSYLLTGFCWTCYMVLQCITWCYVMFHGIAQESYISDFILWAAQESPCSPAAVEHVTWCYHVLHVTK